MNFHKCWRKPALKRADVGIALVDDQVQELPHLLALSKRMMITIK
ncbi:MULTISPECIES: hypothetical protein [Lachnospiraceae]|nr:MULTISPECIES: hypothetical protein [Lachnospiraceae]